MMDDPFEFCNSILSLACLPLIKKYSEVHHTLLQGAIKALENCPYSEKKFTAPAILNSKLALEYDSWYLNSSKTINEIPFSSIVSIKRNAIELSILKDSHFSSVQIAIKNIIEDGGVEYTIDFLKGCWSSFTFPPSLDMIHFYLYALYRMYAFDISLDSSIDELLKSESQFNKIKGDKEDELSILDIIESKKASPMKWLIFRRKFIAQIDKKGNRKYDKLEALLNDETAKTEQKLKCLKGEKFDKFYGGLIHLIPVYYTLKESYYELYFATKDNNKRKEINEKQTFVEERCADINQLLLTPTNGPLISELIELANYSIRKKRRWLNYWYKSRVQINNELKSNLLDTFETDKSIDFDYEKVTNNLNNTILFSLSDSQTKALNLLNNTGFYEFFLQSKF